MSWYSNLLFCAPLFLLFSCHPSQPKAATGPDEAEILIQRLLKQESTLINEIQKTENHCLEEENDMLRGKRVHHRLDLTPGLDRMSQYLQDSEAFIDLHNKRHPESPWAK
jgi:hypothetical protein